MGIDPSKHMGLVYTIANRHRCDGSLFEDIVQEGALGLMKAAEKFDPKKGFAFSTYAQWWIRAYIQRFLQDERGAVAGVHLPAKVFRAKRDAGELPVRISLDKTVVSDDGCTDTWHDLIPDEKPSPEDVAIEKSVRAFVRLEVFGLPTRTQRILRMRFENDMTLEQIGQVLGLTRERIRQILVQAFRDLRPSLEHDT